MRGRVLALLLGVYCVAGCTTVATPTCWVPETKDEMRDLVGQTVIEAMHQYNRYMIQELERNSPRRPERNGYPTRGGY